MAITVVSVTATDPVSLATKVAAALSTHVALTSFDVRLTAQPGEYAALIFTVT
jgi:hypothetical protein